MYIIYIYLGRRGGPSGAGPSGGRERQRAAGLMRVHSSNSKYK